MMWNLIHLVECLRHLVEILKGWSVGGTCFRNINVNVSTKWYNDSWKEFSDTLNVDLKLYSSDYYDVNVKNMVLVVVYR